MIDLLNWLKRGMAIALVFLATVAQAWSDAATIQNRWTSGYLLAGNGLQLSPDIASPNSGWDFEQLPGEAFVRLRSLATGQYLHVENGPLQEGQIEQGWWSAMWSLENADGQFYRLQNRWKPDQYIMTDEAGNVSVGAAEPGWWSAMWSFQAVQAVQPSLPVASTPLSLPPATTQQASATIEQATGQPAVELYVQNFSAAPLDVFIDVPGSDPAYVQTVGPGQQLRQQSPAGATWSLAQNDQWVGDYQLSGQNLQVIRYPESR